MIRFYALLFGLIALVGMLTWVGHGLVSLGSTKCEAVHEQANLNQLRVEKPVADHLEVKKDVDQRKINDAQKQLAANPNQCMSTAMPGFALDRLCHSTTCGFSRPAAVGKPKNS